MDLGYAPHTICCSHTGRLYPSFAATVQMRRSESRSISAGGTPPPTAARIGSWSGWMMVHGSAGLRTPFTDEAILPTRLLILQRWAPYPMDWILYNPGIWTQSQHQQIFSE